MAPGLLHAFITRKNKGPNCKSANGECTYSHMDINTDYFAWAFSAVCMVFRVNQVPHEKSSLARLTDSLTQNQSSRNDGKLKDVLKCNIQEFL